MKITMRFGLFLLFLTVVLMGTWQGAKAFEYDLAGRPAIGPADAPVHIVEVSDYQCRHCAKAAPILHEVVKQYGDLVRVTVVSITVNGPYSEMAAEFALTAFDHGKFEQAHIEMFANQSNLSLEYLVALGKKLGIPEAEVRDNIKNHKHRNILKKNFSLVIDELELEYTPTIYINDFKSHGVKSADFYRYYINQVLKAENIASPVGEVPKPSESDTPQTSQPGIVPPDMIYPVAALKPVDSQIKVKVGQQAPDFELPIVGAPGQTVRLSDYRGKKNIVLSFVPAAWTPACSAQWPEYNENRTQFNELDTMIIGISVDNVPTLFSWTMTMGLAWFKVASDFYPHGQVSELYGILRSNGESERAVIVIDKQGIIRYIDVHDINTRPDMGVLIQELQKLQ